MKAGRSGTGRARAAHAARTAVASGVRACAWNAGAAAALAISATLAAPLAAAPFDQTLSARPEHAGARQLEVAVDAMNDTLDVLDIRGDDPIYGGTNVGDYEGAHLRVGWQLSERWWVDAALWRREIEYRNETGSLNSWQLAAQYRFHDGGPTGTAWALRASAWGNRASELQKGSPTTLSGYTLDSVRIDSPRDRQWQLDLIGTRGGPEASISWYVGVQRSKVDYSSLSGTATAGDCPFDLSFGDSSTTLTQTAACRSGLGTVAAGTRFGVANTELGLDPRDALAYTATVLRAGVNGHKRWGDWHLRGGLGYEYFERDDSLEAAARRLSGVYESGNLSAMLELGYRFTPAITGFVRGTAWQHQLMGEVPFLYNAVTAKRSDRRYGVVSVGASIAF